MSINAQAIIPGHIGIEAVCELFAVASGVTDVKAAPRHRPEHWEISMLDSARAQIVFDVFLNSWAAEDYADVWQGPSTFVTCRYQPSAATLLRTIAATRGGVMRSNEAEDWPPPQFAKTS